jgi:hypothetical protein
MLHWHGNFYRDMWVRRSELLAPLTSMTSKNVKFIWTDEHQNLKVLNRDIQPESKNYFQ